MGCLDAWIEVVPALLIPHSKASNCPDLETITEEELDQPHEEDLYDNEFNHLISSSSSSSCKFANSKSSFCKSVE